MEETVPIIHSGLMRRNRIFSKNPYGVEVWHLRVTFCRKRGCNAGQPANDSARNGA